MIISFVPIWVVDMGGSMAMIVLSFLSIRLAFKLKRQDPQNIIWSYVLWVCMALAVFAISRSAGHIVKQVLIMSGHQTAWLPFRPYSGAINTLTFLMVGSVTLFFERTWTVYQDIIRDRRALQDAHRELLYLNQNLEKRVVARTKALTHSEHNYRRIFEATKDIILVTDRDGEIIRINPAGMELLCIAAHDLKKPSLVFKDFLFRPEDWEEILEKIDRMGFISALELDLKTTPAGRHRVLISGGSEIEMGTGRDTIHFLAKDIAAQHLMREQMARADKLASIGELSSGVAHEINNPLGIILGYTQLMLRQEDSASERHADLKTIEKHVRNCKAIVEDLLNFARTSKPKKELCDIHVIFDDVLSFVRHHSNLERVELSTDYDRRIGELLVDEKKIKQVLINLMMNALHAVGQEGTISIRTALNDKADKARIWVTDNGQGIQPEHLQRIFDPFFTTKPTGEGTGLGLSVSYGIIQNHGGQILVESTPDHRTSFEIILPIPSGSVGR